MESNKPWARVQLPHAFHVLPVNDLKAHEEGDACWCRPVHMFFEGLPMYSHNSADGREFFEGEQKEGH